MTRTPFHRYSLLSLALVLAGLCFWTTPAKAQADTYAAIAYSEKTGHYGYGYNYDNRADAENRALTQCNADDAKIVVWARNAWVALAVSDNNGPYGWGYGDTAAIAKSIALQNVRDRNGQNPRIAVFGYSSK